MKERTDTQRLNALQKMADESRKQIVCRRRLSDPQGFALHTTTREQGTLAGEAAGDLSYDIRKAIDTFLELEGA